MSDGASGIRRRRAVLYVPSIENGGVFYDLSKAIDIIRRRIRREVLISPALAR